MPRTAHAQQKRPPFQRFLLRAFALVVLFTGFLVLTTLLERPEQLASAFYNPAFEFLLAFLIGLFVFALLTHEQFASLEKSGQPAPQERALWLLLAVIALGVRLLFFSSAHSTLASLPGFLFLFLALLVTLAYQSLATPPTNPVPLPQDPGVSSVRDAELVQLDGNQSTRLWPPETLEGCSSFPIEPGPGKNAISRMDCTVRYLVDHNSEAYCREIGDVYISQECSYRVAIEAKRPDWCDFVVLPAKRRDCFAHFGVEDPAVQAS